MKIIFGSKLSEDYYISSFISGLTPELKSAVRMLNPSSLQEAIDLGRDQLDTKEAITRRIKGIKPFGSGHPQPHKNSRPNVKLLTTVEMVARREKGLCFNCDEIFSPGHKCIHDNDKRRGVSILSYRYRGSGVCE